ncbi:ATP-dependent DNA helicase RecG [Aurantivibrio infirmus]
MSASNATLLQDIPITVLKGVGASLSEKLKKLNLLNLQDLVFHLPLRYQDRTKVTALGALKPHMEAVIEGEIRGCEIVFGKRRSMVCVLQDSTGIITLRFYYFSNAQKQQLTTGSKLRCYGEVRRGASGLEIYHPEYKLLSGDSDLLLEETLTPIYPATEGLTQARLRSLVQQSLKKASAENLPELLPAEILQALDHHDLLTTLCFLHSPPKTVRVDLLLAGEHPYQQRLAFEELLAHHLSLLKNRSRVQSARALAIGRNKEIEHRFLSALPFKLTNAQNHVINEIYQDLHKDHPMLRLVQGDVGSGKTLVAAMAALQTVNSGGQVAIMAPTEILAEQHRINFNAWFSHLDINVALLTGKQKAAEKREQLKAIQSGEANIVIGTHALIQTDVEFARLALVVIDEQHRFGVHQRLTLRQKGIDTDQIHPHQLIMTATPIPRTLAMSAYADLDCSVIDELPPGRTPVETVLINQSRREQIIERVNQACLSGRQAYWVCTLIEESDVLEAQAAEVTAAALSEALPAVSVALLHGRIKSQEKEAIMADFKSGKIDLLVATTVIEVGVDVPNASLMIIENPERLGLAQLHQLRGRVGRGRTESHCVLLYGGPLSQTAKARLRVMRESTDGFVIAEKDLEIRGPGEVLGTRQTGEMRFRIADLQRDASLLTPVRRSAQTIIKLPKISTQIINRWIGSNTEYGDV